MIGVFTNVFMPPYVSTFITSLQPNAFFISLYTILVFTVCPLSKSSVSAKHPMMHTFFTNSSSQLSSLLSPTNVLFYHFCRNTSIQYFLYQLYSVTNAPYATIEFFWISVPFSNVELCSIPIHDLLWLFFLKYGIFTIFYNIMSIIIFYRNIPPQNNVITYFYIGIRTINCSWVIASKFIT